MELWQCLAGQIETEISSALPEETLAAIGGENIEIRDLKQLDALTYRFQISRREAEKLAGVCEKHGAIIKFGAKKGLYWLARRGLKRPVLLIGGLAFLALMFWLPTRVLFVQVEGNEQIPASRIIQEAERCGIGFGASRRQVRSERIKNELLAALPELRWAGVNTSGCTAVISVKEKTRRTEELPTSAAAGMQACRDGHILSCTVTQGTALVKPGDTVRKGQLLISGYTDNGLCIRAERAEGEVYAQTNRELEAVFPSERLKKGNKKTIKRKFSLLLRKKRIFLWKDSGIWDTTCGRMYTEYYVTLPGGFRLPFALCVEEYVCQETQKEWISQASAEEALNSFAQEYLIRSMRAGKIIHREQSISCEAGLYRLQGVYDCVEMIGRMGQEQIGDWNGKNS